ncbi:MAG: DUF5723 family protein, partial [Aurantibacter sp.]
MRNNFLLIMAILWVCICMHGQNKQLLYDFNEIPQSLMVNPGVEIDYKWYTAIPATNISFQAGSSGVDVDDIFANDGLDFTD